MIATRNLWMLYVVHHILHTLLISLVPLHVPSLTFLGSFPHENTHFEGTMLTLLQTLQYLFIQLE